MSQTQLNSADSSSWHATTILTVRKGGRVVIAEFSTPTWTPFRNTYRFYLDQVMPRLRAVSTNAPAYDYLIESIRAWPDQAALGELMAEAGWRGVQWKNLAGGIVAVHRGWAP